LAHADKRGGMWDATLDLEDFPAILACFCEDGEEGRCLSLLLA
jgi:hypothetical protein